MDELISKQEVLEALKDLMPDGDDTQIMKCIEAVEKTPNALQYLINTYEHEVETLKQDIEKHKTGVWYEAGKLAAYNRVIRDLKGEYDD